MHALYLYTFLYPLTFIVFMYLYFCTGNLSGRERRILHNQVCFSSLQADTCVWAVCLCSWWSLWAVLLHDSAALPSTREFIGQTHASFLLALLLVSHSPETDIADTKDGLTFLSLFCHSCRGSEIAAPFTTDTLMLKSLTCWHFSNQNVWD